MAVLINILTTYNGAGDKKAMRDLALLQKQATLAGNTMAAGMAKASASMQKTGASMAATGAKMSKFITLPIVAIGAVSVVMAAKFETSMKLIQTQAGGSAKDVKYLSEAVLELGAKGQHGPNELAAALYHLKSVGMDNVTAMKALTQSERLASVGGADLEATTNAVAGAYKSGIKGTKDFGVTVGTLNAIIGAGNLRMEDLNSALGTGFLVSAKTFGVSLTSAGAALAMMTSRGIPATRAATALKMTFAGIAAPSATAEKAFAKLGLKSRDLAVAMREKGLGGALDMLKDKLAGLSKTDQSIALTKMFGAKSSQAILTLLGNLDDFDRTQKQVAANTSKFDELAAAQKEDVTAKWDHFKSSMASASILIGDVLLPTAIRFADALGGVGAWLNKLSPGTRKWAIGLALVAAAIGPVLLIVGKLFLGVGKVIGVVAKLSMVLSANPIGLVVIAIAALVVGFIVLWKKCDWFRNFWIAVWDEVKAVAEAVWPVIKKVGEKIIDALQWTWDKVSGAVSEFWDWAGPFITDSVKLWWTVIKTTFDLIVDVATAQWKAIVATVKWFWDWAGPYITAAVKSWWTVIKTTFTLIAAVVETAWDAISAAVKWFWDWAGPFITDSVKLWWTVIKTTFNTIVAVMQTAWDAIVATVKWFWGWAGPFITTGIGLWWTSIKTTFDLIKAVFDTVWPLIVTVVQTAVATVKAVIDGIRDVIEVVREIWRVVKEVTSNAWDAVVTVVKDAWTAIKTKVENVKESVVTAVGDVWRAVEDKTGAIWDRVVTVVKTAWNDIRDKCVNVKDGVVDAVGGIWNAIEDKTGNVWDRVVGVVKDSWNSIRGFINKILGAFNWVTGHVPGLTHTNYELTGFAKGGYVPRTPGGLAAVLGEGSEGEYVVPESKVGRFASAALAGRVSTPRIMDNGGMGGPVDAISGAIRGALGSAWGWVTDLWNRFDIGSHFPEPVGGLFGGVTGALLDMVKGAVMNLLRTSDAGVGMRIIDFAKTMLGVPYLWGGTSPAGFDCSGLPYWSYAQAGRSIPRIPTNGGRQVPRGDVQPADIMFYYPGAIQNGVRVPFGHFKMYAGGDQTIESTSGGVQMRPADWGGAAQIRRYLAKGGYVPRTPGGLAAVLGEGSEGEYVVPESKVGRFASAALAGSGGVYIAPGAVVVSIDAPGAGSPAEVTAAVRAGVDPALEALARAITAL